MSISQTRRFVLGGLACGAAAFPAVRTAAQASNKVVLTMGGDGFQFVTQHLALRGGFFREEGLEAEMLDVGSGPRQVAALMNGSSAFSSLGMIHVIKANAEGAELVAVSTEFDVIDIQLVLSNAAIAKAGITPGMGTDETVRRLKGLRIAISSPGSTTDTYVRNLLRARKLDPDKELEIRPIGGGSNMLAALEQGAVDGFAWGAPQAQVAALRGLGKSVINPFDGGVPEVAGMPYLVIVTSRATFDRHPETIRKGVRAMARAIRFAATKPDEAKAALRQQFPTVDAAIFDAAWEQYRKGIPRSVTISREQFDTTQQWLALAGPKPAVAYEKAVSTRYAAEADALIKQ